MENRNAVDSHRYSPLMLIYDLLVYKGIVSAFTALFFWFCFVVGFLFVSLLISHVENTDTTTRFLNSKMASWSYGVIFIIFFISNILDYFRLPSLTTLRRYINRKRRQVTM